MTKLHKKSLLHALGVGAYITLVALFMTNAENVLGQANNIIGVMSILTLLVMSVAVVGLLIFLKPAMMYLDSKKKEAVQLLIWTIGWIFVLFVIFLLIILVI